METKVNDPSTETKVINIISKSENPVSIDYVRHHSGLNWSTARAVLLSLALEGKIGSQKTSKSWIFWLDKQNGADTP